MSAAAPRPRRPVIRMLLSVGALTTLACILYAAFWLVDVGGRGDFLTMWPHAAEAIEMFASLALGVLGVALTVVAIVVELAAGRYTPRIGELFVRDPVNVGVMGYLVVTVIFTLWVGMSLETTPYPTVMVVAATVMTSLALLVLLPYFAYVFAFLTPERVIGRIGQLAVASMTKAATASPAALERARDEIVTGIEQLADMVLNAVKGDEKGAAVGSLEGLRDVAMRHLEHKRALPAAWFDVAALGRKDQDFVALDPAMIRAMIARRTWVEMKAMRSLQTAFQAALGRLPDVAHLVSIHTRQIACAALAAGDVAVVRLVMRFFNSYLRDALGAGDLRSMYNVLNEYRALGCALLDAGHHDLACDFADKTRLYGQAAFHQTGPFILETVAHDICVVLEHAHAIDSPLQDRMLDVFLEVDHEADNPAREVALRGVRKAQVKLATYYLARGDDGRARRIHDDMRCEDASRLASIHRELGELTEREWWEVSNRDTNWDWLPEDQRGQLDAFFGWFEST